MPKDTGIFDFCNGTLPKAWTEAPFVANGLLSAVAYIDFTESNFDWQTRFDPAENEMTGIQIVLGRSDVFDRGTASARPLWSAPNRIPIAKLILSYPEGTLHDGHMSLNTKKATINGKILSDTANFSWYCYVHAIQPIIVVKLIGDQLPDLEVAMAEKPRWIGGPGTLPDDERLAESKESTWSIPKQEILQEDGIHLKSRYLLDGTRVAVAWKNVWRSEREKIIYISIGNDPRNKQDALITQKAGMSAREEAVSNIDDANAQGEKVLRKSHIQWWDSFLSRSQVTLPDKEFQYFYDLQNYKLGCMFREDGPLPDEAGPWSIDTKYPCHWWDLNVQDLHSIHLKANYPEFTLPLARLLIRNYYESVVNWRDAIGSPRVTSFRFSLQKHLPKKDPDPYAKPTTPHIIWLCHHLMDYYFYTQDKRFLPFTHQLLKGAIHTYLLEERVVMGDDGFFHLVHCQSPEYPGANHDAGMDSNYELSLFKWGCQAFVLTSQLTEDNSSFVKKVKNISKKLAPFPVNENGYMISASVPVESAHRHYSHLMMLFPLDLLPTRDEHEIARKSLLWWMSDEVKPERKGRSGFTYTGAASMAAMLGMGEHAFDYLAYFLKHGRESSGNFTRSRIWPNTMYTEYGPTVETPMAFNRAIHDMLLFTRSGELRLLPAIPADWESVSFESLRMHGGHLVSLDYADNKLKRVKIECQSDDQFTVFHPQIHYLAPDSTETKPGQRHFFVKAGETIELNMK
ncbi:hypothetical protein GF406_22640 [candidate division KSB1 bacterium]|nr:hypothetical protein [candidate division KSB1 bacterium]